MLILPPRWYLVAWGPARGDYRHFRMDRIGRPECIESMPFRRRRVQFGAEVTPISKRLP
jgi:predicted DNA-binding transcriptional regulator YafY